MSIIFRRFIAFLLSIFLVFFTTISSYANTSTGGWTALDTITAGASNTINATKTAGGKVLNSAVTVGASANKVGKYLIKGAGGAALAFAMVELLDAGIDWVLDPANNRVIYTQPSDSNSDPYPEGFAVGTYQSTYSKDYISTNPVTAANMYCAGLGYGEFSYFKPRTNDTYIPFACLNESGQEKGGTLYYKNVPVDTSNPTDSTEKYIPIDTVAAQVISNAEAGHAESQEAVKATALEGFAAGEHDTALEAAAVESDVALENPTDPNNPTDPQDPAIPFDPSSIIAAINALKAMLAGIFSSITSLSDFFQSDPPPEPSPEDTKLDIPIPDLPTPDTDINFVGSCPSNFEFKGSIFGNPINIVLLDTAMLCDFLATYVKYPVYAASSLFALYILGGRKDV